MVLTGGDHSFCFACDRSSPPSRAALFSDYRIVRRVDNSYANQVGEFGQSPRSRILAPRRGKEVDSAFQFGTTGGAVLFSASRASF